LLGLVAAQFMAFKLFYGEKGWGGNYLFHWDRRFPVEARKLAQPIRHRPDQPYPLFALVGALRQLADQGVSSRGDLAAVSHQRQRAHIRLNLNWAREAAWSKPILRLV
jgi:hypothetical protein